MGLRAKRGCLICFQGQRERKGVVMGYWSWDEQQDIKLSLSRLTCMVHRTGDLTSCSDRSCQGKEQGIFVSAEETQTLLFCLGAQIFILSLYLWNCDRKKCQGNVLQIGLSQQNHQYLSQYPYSFFHSICVETTLKGENILRKAWNLWIILTYRFGRQST